MNEKNDGLGVKGEKRKRQKRFILFSSMSLGSHNRGIDFSFASFSVCTRFSIFLLCFFVFWCKHEKMRMVCSKQTCAYKSRAAHAKVVAFQSENLFEQE
jgi:hypothetical protein